MPGLPRRVPDELIDQIRSANDIVDVISERIQVKRAGRNYRALCPFHQEKTPSFNINPERQIYHCFGCGAGGNVITFLMEHDKIGFLDAVRELADRAGIRLPARGGPGEGATDDPVYAANAMALDYFRRSLRSDGGRAARDFVHDRGLSDEVVDTFALGYAPAGWDGLLRAGGEAGFASSALEEAGLVVARDGGGHYDRFRDRFMFPLLASGGRAVGFGGRSLGDQEPKYLNSPETRVYHKGRFLYGLAEARTAMRLAREVILVEGYMDLLTLHEAGFRNVVASAGTALTPEQAKVLARYADKVFVAYDGDAAGIAAAVRASEALVCLGLKVRVASFPEGSDPDSFLREAGPEALRERLSGALDFIDFLVACGPTETAEDREVTARRLIDVVARVEDPLVADLMLEKIAAALSIRRSAVARACAVKKEEGERQRRTSRGRDDAPVIESAELSAQKGLLSLLIAGGPEAVRIRSTLDPRDLTDPAVRSLAERIWASAGAVDVAALLTSIGSPDETRLLTELAVLPASGRDGARLCDDYIRTIERARIGERIRTLDLAIQTAEMTESDDRLLALAAERQDLARRLRELTSGE